MDHKYKIKKMGKNLYMGWIPDFKGLVVQGYSRKDINKKLDISLLVKFSYDKKKLEDD